MSNGAVIAWGGVIGLVLGIGIGLTTEIPFAPEAGLVAGGLVAWLVRRDSGGR